MSQEMESKLFFELGQMIKIYAPTIPDINEKIYLIDYLDDNIIKLIIGPATYHGQGLYINSIS